MKRLRASKFTIDALHRKLAKQVILLAYEQSESAKRALIETTALNDDVLTPLAHLDHALGLRIRLACDTLGWSKDKAHDWAWRTIAARPS